MTCQQAIERANDMKTGNAAPDNLKYIWLTELERYVINEVIKTHNRDGRRHHHHDYSCLPYHEHPQRPAEPDEAPEEFTGYEPDTDGDTELIAAAPYDEMYVYWLMAKIDLFSQEVNKYNADNALFESVYENYKRWYHRNNRSNRTRRIRVGMGGFR